LPIPRAVMETITSESDCTPHCKGAAAWWIDLPVVVMLPRDEH
jgi:hypothetical protein